MAYHGQTMVAGFNLTMVNHGLTMVKTLSDHGQPWSLTMVQPCSSLRSVDNECLDIRYLTMSDHGHLIFECGADHGQSWLLDHGQPWFNHDQNIARPWSNHGSTMVDNGLTMFIPQGYGVIRIYVFGTITSD